MQPTNKYSTDIQPVKYQNTEKNRQLLYKKEGHQSAALIIITSLLLYLLLFHYKVEDFAVAAIA
jgi:hypothetical protein